MRDLSMLHRSVWLAVFNAAFLVGGSSAGLNAQSSRNAATPRAKASEKIPTPEVVDGFIWPELKPGVAARGEADEPDIANMGADWSNEVELRASVDHTEFDQLDRIRVVCEATNASGQNHIWMPPFHPLDHYLRLRVRVFDSRGKLLPMTEFYKHEGRVRVWEPGGNSSGGGSLNPGETLRMEVEPNIIYDMTRPGDYWILVEMPLGASFVRPGEGLFFIRAQPMKVKVKPEALDFSHTPKIIRRRGRQ